MTIRPFSLRGPARAAAHAAAHALAHTGARAAAHACALAAGALLVLGACSPTPEAAAGSAPETAAGVADTAVLSAESMQLAGFTTARVQQAEWRETWRVPGRLALDAASTEPIGSIVEGRVVRVYAMPGDRVRAGQVLVAIHSHEMMDARAAHARARAELTRAEAALGVADGAAARGERLLALKALSTAEMERLRAAAVDARAMRDAAAAELTRAEEFLEHLLGDGPVREDLDPHWVLIRAPLDGLVVTRDVQPGNVVLVGAPLLTVSRTSALTLVMQVPDVAAAATRVGAPVSFSVNAYPGERFTARVTRVFPALDTLTRTVEVHASVADHRGRLRAEMFVNAELSGAAAGQVLVVPAGAVQSLDGDTVVIAMEPLGEATKLAAVRVRVGRRNTALAELVAGIDTGRTVIVGGAAVAKAEILKRRGGDGASDH